MICEIWIRSFAYFRHFTLSIRRIWPALYIFARTFLVSRARSSLEKGGSYYRKTNSVPYENQRSMHRFIDPLINDGGRLSGVQVTLCAERDGAQTPFSRFAASRWFTSSIPRRVLPILPSVPLRPLTRHRVADEPCDRLCSCSESRCSGWKIREPSRGFLRLRFVQLNLWYRGYRGLRCREKSRKKENPVSKNRTIYNDYNKYIRRLI